MNKIQIEDIKNEERNYVLEEDSLIIIKNSNVKINFTIKKNIKVFKLIESSSLNISYDVYSDFILNIFSMDSGLDITSNLNENNIKFDYVYSTINESSNKYKITVNHFGKDITSNIVSHGINMKNNKLSFTVNTIIPKNSDGVNTNQDSKIITLDRNNSTIKPNLLVDNDDTTASHSAYIGEFKDEDLFYFETRGLDKKTSEKLLAKSFLIGQMNISFREKDMIFEILKRYWR